MRIFLNKEVTIDDIIEILVEKLEKGGTVTFSPSGTSMLPMLRDGEDVVVLSKPKGRLHLFDIPLYKRKDGSYVLHRIVDFDADGGYVLRGDNQFVKEHGIYDKDIYGVVTAFYRKGKSYTTNSLPYRIYLNLWFYSKIFRHLYFIVKNKMERFFDKKDKADDENKTEQN